MIPLIMLHIAITAQVGQPDLPTLIMTCNSCDWHQAESVWKFSGDIRAWPDEENKAWTELSVLLEDVESQKAKCKEKSYISIRRHDNSFDMIAVCNKDGYYERIPPSCYSGAEPCEYHSITQSDEAKVRVEHVIEIRTKRDLRDIGSSCNVCDETGCTLMYCAVPSASECQQDEYFTLRDKNEIDFGKPALREHYYCERDTKTLYVDGVRWGVLRETEDK